MPQPEPRHVLIEVLKENCLYCPAKRIQDHEQRKKERPAFEDAHFPEEPGKQETFDKTVNAVGHHRKIPVIDKEEADRFSNQGCPTDEKERTESRVNTLVPYNSDHSGYDDT